MRAVCLFPTALALVLFTTGCAVQHATKFPASEPHIAMSTASHFCDITQERTAGQQDRLLRFSAVVRDALAVSQGDAVLISRSGLDLKRFQIRYSHAAVALRSDNGAWTVRQLYYACDEGRPRIYDQGMAGFVTGTESDSLGYISIVTLPTEAALTLKNTALDRPRALRLLAAHYSANAYAFGLEYQNCNQWVAELLAVAWGNLPDAPDLRARAQRWLWDSGYAPKPVDVDSRWLMAASAFVPLLHLTDHPEADRAAMKLQVSLPSTVESFIHQRYPFSQRIEICHDGTKAVMHKGWDSVEDGCKAMEGDLVVPLGGK